jgi:hypothetical protein
LWEYVLGGATLFGLIVGLFSVYNGRATRKLMLEQERRTQELIEKIAGRLSEQHETMIQILKELRR